MSRSPHRLATGPRFFTQIGSAGTWFGNPGPPSLHRTCLVDIAIRVIQHPVSNNERVLVFSVYLSFTRLQAGHGRVLTLAQLDMAFFSISGLITFTAAVCRRGCHNSSSYSTRSPLSFPLLSLCPQPMALPQINFPRYSMLPQPNTRG